MKNNSVIFKETLLNQIKDYLDGKITKEEYYEIAEPFILNMQILIRILCFMNIL